MHREYKKLQRIQIEISAKCQKNMSTTFLCYIQKMGEVWIMDSSLAYANFGSLHMTSRQRVYEELFNSWYRKRLIFLSKKSPFSCVLSKTTCIYRVDCMIPLLFSNRGTPFLLLLRSTISNFFQVSSSRCQYFLMSNRHARS